jgi:hypothetical protein
MSQSASDLIELSHECRDCAELRRLALNLISAGVLSYLGGC